MSFCVSALITPGAHNIFLITLLLLSSASTKSILCRSEIELIPPVRHVEVAFCIFKVFSLNGARSIKQLSGTLLRLDIVLILLQEPSESPNARRRINIRADLF